MNNTGLSHSITEHDNVAKTLFTKEQDEILKQLYPVLGTDVVAFLPFTRKHISTRAYGLGLRVSHESKSQKSANLASRPRPDLCGVDAESFIKCDTPEIAYLLGILWADGHVSKRGYRIVLSIIEQDARDISEVVMSTGKWCSRLWQPPGTRKPQISFSTSNKVLHQFLTDMDYQSKNLDSACKILNHIPSKFRHYWWRGFFDGDGCLCNRIRGKRHDSFLSLCGSYCQNWQYVENLFMELQIETKIKFEKNNRSSSSKVVIYNRNDITRFCSYIYQMREQDGVGLSRKYTLAQAQTFISCRIGFMLKICKITTCKP